MNLQQIIDEVLVRMNKDQSGMSISPEKWTTIFRSVNINFTKLKLGLPEEYSPYSPFPRQAYQITQRMQDDTRHLVTPFVLAPNAQGIAEMPGDYIYHSSLVYNYSYNMHGKTVVEPKDVELLNDQSFTSRITSQLKKPSHKNVVARFLDGRIQFAPHTIAQADMVYVRKPNEPLYAYTVNSNDEYVYNHAASVQFEWPEICHTDIANMVLGYLSDNFRDMFIKQSVEQRKQAGQ
jgi:hypothetical protein